MHHTVRLAVVVLCCSVFGCGGEATPTASRPSSAPGASPSSSADVSGARPDTATAAGPTASAAPGSAVKPAPAEAQPAAAPTKPAAFSGGSGASTNAPSWKALAAALGGRDIGAKEAAAAELERREAEAAGALLSLLGDDAAEVRRGAALFLSERFDPADVKLVQAFSKALADRDATVRHIALAVVNRFPREAAAAVVPQLTGLLAPDREDAAHRAVIVRLLGNLQVDPSGALTVLRRAAETDPEPSVRSAALVTVAKLAPPSDAVAVLHAALKSDRAAAVRGLAAVRLGKLGVAAGVAAGDLAAALEDADEAVRRQAADALVQIGDAAVAPLVDKLASVQAATRQLALSALARLGLRAKPALPQLRERLTDSDAQVRKLAEAAVKRLEAGNAP